MTKTKPSVNGGIKSYKLEFFPDMKDGDDKYGPCALVLHFHKPNSKRFNSMSDLDKANCLNLIDDFQQHLTFLKRQIRKIKSHVHQ